MDACDSEVWMAMARECCRRTVGLAVTPVGLKIIYLAPNTTIACLEPRYQARHTQGTS